MANGALFAHEMIELLLNKHILIYFFEENQEDSSWLFDFLILQFLQIL